MKQYELKHSVRQELGCTVTKDGYHFAVHSRDAKRIDLCLFDAETESQIAALPMPSKTGNIWHGFLPCSENELYYGYRCHGSYDPGAGNYFDPEKLLIDPYARQLSRKLVWNPELYSGNSQEMIPKARIRRDNRFDWQGVEKPQIEENRLVNYEVHVKGFTIKHPEVEEAHRGTYLGLINPQVIQYLKDLGINCVQLMPVHSFMPEPTLTERGLTNYWGYNPVNFFAPESRYAVKDSVNEFKTMVRELHRHGIKVILDVVYNHTAEAGYMGATLSFRGFDNQGFYLYQTTDNGGLDYTRFTNNSGCGNSVNMMSNFALRLILDSLRYWATEMQVDGFRFDLAASLGREKYEFHSNSSFLRAFRQDPILSQCIAIAEPWDIGMGGYRLGQFPSVWNECNDKYRDQLRSFWRGDEIGLGGLATRLMGSRDIFPKNRRPIQSSVNYITYHDGFTLRDLVSYNDRHNQANGESNLDGSSNNISYNYGVEGDTENEEIHSIRQRQMRNFFMSLLVSQGMPHILAGDEIGRTQGGNNNAYCQDNPISWVSWQLKDWQQELNRFVAHVIALRGKYRLLRNINLEDDNYFQEYEQDAPKTYNDRAYWFKPSGENLRQGDWANHSDKVLALMLEDEDADKKDGDRLLILINAGILETTFQLPRFQWKLLADSRYSVGINPEKRVEIDESYTLISRSMALLGMDAEG